MSKPKTLKIPDCILSLTGKRLFFLASETIAFEHIPIDGVFAWYNEVDGLYGIDQKLGKNLARSLLANIATIEINEPFKWRAEWDELLKLYMLSLDTDRLGMVNE